MTSVRMQTSEGSILIQLEDELTPKTVANFLSYVDEGFYNQTIFHRTIKNFMIQGGGFESGMKQKPTKAPIENEAASGLKNEIGTIAMARLPDPHSASSQFFINVAHNAFLNFTGNSPEKFGYCAFGKVVEGLDIILKMSTVPTTNRAGHQDVPVTELVILSMERV